MTDFLPEEVRAGLEKARRAAERKKSKLRVVAGDVSVPVLRAWDTGFAIAAEEAAHLRGLVDIYEGERHMGQQLIVTSREEDGEWIYDVKRTNIVMDRAPKDFAVAEDAPAALIEGPRRLSI